VKGQTQSFRFELRSARHLAELDAAPLPGSLVEGPPVVSRHRDLYLDTADDGLRRRDISCRLRIADDDTRTLSLWLRSGNGALERYDSRVKSPDVTGALAENTSVGRRVRALLDPSRLVVRLEIETDRTTRRADRTWMRRFRLEVMYDRSAAHRDGVSASMYQLKVRATNGDSALAAAIAGAFEASAGLRPMTEGTRERAELLLRWKSGSETIDPTVTDAHEVDDDVVETEFLNPELSLLAFQSRVLCLAENASTPLHERLRFLSIVSSNIDEFFMIRVAGLRQAAREQSEEQCDDGLTRRTQLRLISAAIDDLARRQSACATTCLRELETEGVRIMSWADLGSSAKAELRRRCIEEIHPDLTPMAMTLSPGHPLPHLPHLTLALAVAYRDAQTGRIHLAELELPATAARFFSVPGLDKHFITLEEVVRGNVDLLHPSGRVEGVYAFRVTRGGDLALDEEAADDLIEAVTEASERRTGNPAVRIEVERSMPEFVRSLLIANLMREDPSSVIDSADIREVDGLLDLTCLSKLALPPAPASAFEPFTPAPPLTGEMSIFDAVRAGDLMFHHPFDSFEQSVLRFLEEAAVDPDVTTIRITLYRLGSSSPVADALIRAAKKGKKVIAFVELKARFDEEHNVNWARKLEKAGGHVVSGLIGVKNHAKAAMIVRREDQRLASYVHVGTGNYNTRSAREYTDLSLLSSREDVVQDVNDLFNSLTGGSLPPRGLSRGSLVAPHQMADALVERIEREAANARAGKQSGITIKVNGLSDPVIVRSLLRAAEEGVEVNLICRGICTLRPPASSRVRVFSHVGRFLEHSRVYRFSNGGSALHYIGSADLRHRNLRRRVELLVPVIDAGQKERLDRILDLYLDDPYSWRLGSDGSYVQGEYGRTAVHDILLPSQTLATMVNSK
jgi:polyphosphate kinase